MTRTYTIHISRMDTLTKRETTCHPFASLYNDANSKRRVHNFWFSAISSQQLASRNHFRLYCWSESTQNTPNQRYECHLGIPRVVFSGFETPIFEHCWSESTPNTRPVFGGFKTPIDLRMYTCIHTPV